MKAALGHIPDKYIYSAFVGGTPLAAIYQGTKKIWPDNSNRITAITFDASRFPSSIDGAYWELALQTIASGATASRFIKLFADRTYCINSSYSPSIQTAYYEGNGRITFPNGTGPIANALKIGGKITLRLITPAFDSIRITGTEADGKHKINEPGNKTLTHTYPRAIPGTSVRRLFSKGVIKISTGVRTQIQSLPSGLILHDAYRQQNGHGRSYPDEDAYPYQHISFQPGDSALQLTVWSHQARGNWGGYLRYPSINHTITPTILRIETAS